MSDETIDRLRDEVQDALGITVEYQATQVGNYEPPPGDGADPAVVIQIDKDRKIKINQDPVEESALQARLESIFATRAERVVFIRGDKDLEYEPVARAIDIAKGAGIDKIGLMTPKVEIGQ